MNKEMIQTASTTVQDEQILISRAEYEALLAERNELSQKLDYLMKKKTFGTSSEQATEQLAGQLSFLFNETEVWASQKESSAGSTTVASHTRKKKAFRLESTLPEGIEVEVVEHGIPEEERVCGACGTVMQPIGKESVRTLVLHPATATVREDVYYTYACPKCKTDAEETPIQKTEHIPAVIPGSFASPEAIAYIMAQKYGMGSPLYRLEQELNRAGIPLSRQTMSNWLIIVSDKWLMPIYKEMHRLLVREKVLHADETTLQVLREEGKSAQPKSYMWLYRTGIHASQQIVLYEYQPNRKVSIFSLLVLKDLRGDQYVHLLW